MIHAGKLSERLTFLARTKIDDGAGNTEGDLVPQFARWAEVRLRPGSEAFQQARVQGAVPADVRVRRDPETETIATDWVAEDARGVRWNIAAPVADPMDRGAIVFTMTAGRALG
jgi:head-tail adaptor